ncbi:MAG: prolyl hydroxylase family protein [Wenzhouxiangella sp.]
MTDKERPATSLAVSYADDLSRRTVVEALERRLHGRPVPASTLLDHAGRQPEFAGAWLAHALGSAAGLRELALVLAVADRALPKVLSDLGDFWTDVAGRLGLSFDQALADQKCVAILREHGIPEAAHSAPVVRVWAVLEAMQGVVPVNQGTGPVAIVDLPVASRYLDELRELARPRLQAADVYGQQQKGEKLPLVRDSDQALMDTPTASPLLGCMERLMAVAAGKALAYAEPMVILRYAPGQQYHWHRDYIQPSSEDVRREIASFGQRIHTGIVYLNDGFEGGETEFRDWALSLRPRAGQCIGFSSVDAEGNLDANSIHRGTPVIRGEKWIGTLWFRSRRLWSREGLLGS